MGKNDGAAFTSVHSCARDHQAVGRRGNAAQSSYRAERRANSTLVEKRGGVGDWWGGGRTGDRSSWGPWGGGSSGPSRSGGTGARSEGLSTTTTTQHKRKRCWKRTRRRRLRRRCALRSLSIRKPEWRQVLFEHTPLLTCGRRGARGRPWPPAPWRRAGRASRGG